MIDKVFPMKKFTYLFLFLFIAISCNQSEFVQMPEEKGAMLLDSGAVFDPMGGTLKYPIYSEVPWHFSNIPDWITITDNKSNRITETSVFGPGTKTFMISAAMNEEVTSYKINPKKELLKLISEKDGSIIETLDLLQEYPYFNVTIKDSDGTVIEINNLEKENPQYEFLWDESNQEPFLKEGLELSVSSNINWKFISDSVSDESWLVTPPTGEYTSEDITFSLTKVIPSSINTTGKLRSSSFVFAGPDNRNKTPIFQYGITFSQKSIKLLVNGIGYGEDSTATIILPACYAENAQVIIESELPWRISNNSSWVTLFPDSPAGDGSMTESQSFELNANHEGCKFHSNPSEEEMSARIDVVVTVRDGLELEMPVNIIQAPFPINLSSDSLLFSNGGNEFMNFEISSYGNWRVLSDSPEWFYFTFDGTPNETENIVTRSLSVNTFGQNFEFEPLKDDIILQNDLNGIIKTIPVIQGEFVFKAIPEVADINTNSTAEYRLNVESSGLWSASVSSDGSSESDWLSISNSDVVSNNGSVSYWAYDQNSTNYDRVAYIVIKSVTHLERGIAADPLKIRISQRKFVFFSNYDNSSSFQFDALAKESIQINLTSSLTWSVESPDWIGVSQKSGSGDGTIILTPKTNPYYSARNGSVVISSEPLNGKVTKLTYKISQDKFVFNVSKSEISNIPAYIGNNEKYETSIECTGDWRVSEKPSWVSISKESGDAGNSTIELSPSSNNTKSSRTGIVKIFSNLNNDTKEISLIQNPYIFDENQESLSFKAINTDQNIIQITSSGPWKLTDVPDWITVTPTSGTGNGSIKISAGVNYSVTERQQTIYITDSQNLGFAKPVKIVQSALVFDNKPVIIQVDKAINNAVYKLTASDIEGNWSVKNLPDWISVDKKEGKGALTINLTFADNYQTSQRSSTFEIQSQYYSNNNELTKKVTVSQEGFTFDTSTETLSFESTDNLRKAKTITLGECDGAWSVTSSDSWVHVSPQFGTGSQTLTIYPDENLTDEQRTATIYVQSKYIKENESLVKKIEVTQNTYILNLEETSITIGDSDVSEHMIAVTCSDDDWTASCSASWLSVKKKEGAIVIQATSKNTSKKNDRTATVEVKSKTRYSVKATLKVTQSHK